MLTRVPFRYVAILTGFFAHSRYSESLVQMIIILKFDFLTNGEYKFFYHDVRFSSQLVNDF